MSYPTDTVSRRPRRPLPEPIETLSRSSKKRQDDLSAQWNLNVTQTVSQPPKSELIPSTNHHPSNSHNLQANEPKRISGSANGSQGNHADLLVKDARKQRQNPRRFTPQLMETARHSFPGGRTNQDAIADTYPQTSIDTDTTSHRPGHPVIPESRFSYYSLLRRQEGRRHSFRVPDLPAIPSSCSESSNESDPRPVFSSRSIQSHISELRLNTGVRYGGDPDSDPHEYILSFPVDQSETQLKEQALAAFPNEQVYQPVDHFAIDKEEDEYDYEEGPLFRGSKRELRIHRRASSTDLPWELEHLRRYKEDVRANRHHASGTREAGFSHAVRRHLRSPDKAVRHDERWDVDRQLTRLGHTASPPMLGGDLVFPQSLTPETTVCEKTHTIDASQCRHVFTPSPGLWSADLRPTASQDCGGLWHGTCKSDAHSTHYSETMLSGLITPIHVFDENTWETSHEPSISRAKNQHNLDVAARNLGNNSRDDECNDQEFHDGFVTQIYDYLSLGYPSVARYYDYELSRVSGVPVAALRANDLNTDAKGHVGVNDGTGRGSAGGVCMRWVALRLYIHEWARQQPRLVDTDTSYEETWGVRERKGSWAV